MARDDRSDRPAGTDDPAGLVDRRAALLGTGPRGGDRGAGRATGELDEVTERLRELLAERPPVLRSVAADDPLARTLLRREPVHPVDGGGGGGGGGGGDSVDGGAFDRALADRTDVDRRLFVLEHPMLVGRPLNVLWVALCPSVPSTMAELLDHRPAVDPRAATVAVFWSIWNGERGLTGLGRGLDLIEGAAARLADELPGIETLVTLSPVPGLRSWLAEHAPSVDPTDDAGLSRAAARYLTSLRPDGRPVDPVARFHLGNGARLWRIDPGADPSDRGRERSHGLMVNYRYAPEDRAANRALLASGAVATSVDVDVLLDDR